MKDFTKTRCCFIGHRKIDKSPYLEERIYRKTERLIKTGVNTFLFGSNSEFDSLCYEIVSNLKKKYPKIRRIYIRAEYPDIDEDYTAYLLERYEDTYYPAKIRSSGRAAYIERNIYMINQCSICIFYYKDGYLPPRRRSSKRDLTNYQPKSGTETAYNYAVKKQKEVINIAY